MSVDATKIRFTVRPSRFDNRDILYKVEPRSRVDLREWDSAVDSQSDLGSCVGNAIANAYELMLRRLYPSEFVELSRLFIYYNARHLEGTTFLDNGAYIRSGLRAVRKYGVCKESIWEYNLSMFDDKPSLEAYTDARSRTISKYTRLMYYQDVITSINNDTPVVIGIDVFDSFLTLTNENPIVKEPTFEDRLLGGHAMCVVGYDLGEKMFLVKNSFGVDWGAAGYCWIPFNYLDYYAWDLWNFDILLTQT